MRRADLDDLPTTIGVERVAAFWGCSTWSVYEGVKRGDLPVMPLRIGRRLVWPTAAVLRSLGLSGNGEGPAAEAGPSLIAASSPDNQDRAQA